MPQQQGIYEEFTARRFLTYMALLKDIPKPEIEKEIERVLELVHLSQVADQLFPAPFGPKSPYTPGTNVNET